MKEREGRRKAFLCLFPAFLLFLFFSIPVFSFSNAHPHLTRLTRVALISPEGGGVPAAAATPTVLSSTFKLLSPFLPLFPFQNPSKAVTNDAAFHQMVDIVTLSPRSRRIIPSLPLRARCRRRAGAGREGGREGRGSPRRMSLSSGSFLHFYTPPQFVSAVPGRPENNHT